ncbi:MAG: DUF2147 domain-containing protein [Ignavibacteriae bacterium]|nr:DUF2147 domain-containing protein [Ignavibacteriota bacterium]
MASKLKIFSLLLFLFILTQFTIAQEIENKADVIVGTWVMEDDMGVLEIFKEGETYSGKMLWMKEKEEDGSPLLDKENPDESLQNREVEGLKIMSDFKYKGENEWSEGKFYAVLKGKHVEPDFILVDKDHLNIEISFLTFSKTIELKRVDATKYMK